MKSRNNLISKLIELEALKLFFDQRNFMPQLPSNRLSNKKFNVKFLTCPMMLIAVKSKFLRIAGKNPKEKKNPSKAKSLKFSKHF